MDVLRIDDEGPVRRLTMHRPERHNALDDALTKALVDALRAADRDGHVRSVVLAGAGPSFCAGADTREFAGLTPGHPARVLARADLTSALHLAFARMDKPVVAAVHGHALGGGAGLALACDLVVMAEDVRFGYPELRHGIVPAIVMANLVRQAGRKAAFELVALGEPIDGARALALGLANRVVPAAEVLATATGLGDRLAGWAPLPMATTKRLFHRMADLALEPALQAGRDANVMMRGFRDAGRDDASA